MDRLVAAVLLLIVAPVLLIAALAVRVESPGPVLFRQVRVGWREQPFDILKLRSMHVDPMRVDEQTRAGSKGVTKVGALIRRFKIDEIPQLFNVLWGDMAMIGPRPCLPDLLAEMDEVAKRRFDVRPGLTGLAQVSGNIELTWQQRWLYDVQYVERASFALDLKIFVRTIAVVLLGERRTRRAPS